SLRIERREVAGAAVERRVAAVVIVVCNECTGLKVHALERGVVNLNFAAVEVCDIQVVLAAEFGDRAALVDSFLAGVVDNDDSGGTAVPRCNCAVFSYKDEPGRGAARQFEVIGAVEDHPGRCRGCTLTSRNRNRNDKSLLGSGSVINCGQ